MTQKTITSVQGLLFKLLRFYKGLLGILKVDWLINCKKNPFGFSTKGDISVSSRRLSPRQGNEEIVLQFYFFISYFTTMFGSFFSSSSRKK